MNLRELLGDLREPAFATLGDDTVEIAAVAADSRGVERGALFFALPGTRTSGARFVDEACRRGAAAIVGAPELTVPPGVTFVATREPGRLLARAAARLHGSPTTGLTMVGITGTNGKTTVTYLLEAIWKAAGVHPGVLGTVSYRCGDRIEPAPLTTPAAPELFVRLAAMRAAGATHVAMEVSSHALVQGRTDGIEWDVAIFTNLGRDHLDFHRDLEDYFNAKARLFHALDLSPKPRRTAVLNATDARVAGLGEVVRSRVVTFGPGGDVYADAATMTLEGTRAEIVLGAERLAVRTRLVGSGHMENVLAAVAAAHALGTPLAAIARGIEDLPGVPGRLEQVGESREFSVLVDYAHTADALAGVLATLRALVPGRLICVFGCGGDRDRGKRPLMGEAVGCGADIAILTSDNPRTEDPLAIIADAEPGLASSGLPRRPNLASGERCYVVLPDRAQAIASAITCARAGDCVLIAGKGHEDYQIVGTEKLAFDDRATARRVLAGLRRRP